MQALKFVYPRSLKHLSKHLYSLLSKKLWMKILIAMVLGIGIGILMSPQTGILGQDMASIVGDWVALPGKLFLGLIQMIVVPLVFTSIIRGLAASEDVEQLKKIGLRLVLYFIFTTTIAISIGVIIALVIQPGNFIDLSTTNLLTNTDVPSQSSEAAETISSSGVPEMIINILPQNPLNSMVNKEMLQVVIFSLIIGLALVSMAAKKAKVILEMMGAVQDICMIVVKWAMAIAPFAVFGLLAQITMKVGLDALLGMATYVGTVLLGLFILLLFYMIIVTVFGKKNPLKFLSAIRDVQLLAFSTSSSAAVMPLSIETAEDKLDVRPSISQFLIPLGATINMDGTALYQGVATIFLAQVYEVDLALPTLLLIIITTVGASIGSPATPGVGIVILSMVLKSAGIPASGVALIIGVDRILDMSRTALNVTGDLTACTVMNRWVPGKKTYDEEQSEDVIMDQKRQATGEDVIITDEDEDTIES